MSMRKVALIVAAVAAIGIGLVVVGSGLAATSYPADKAGVVASDVDTGTPGEDMTLLETHMKTSSTSDLILSVTAECSLITDVSTMGTDDQQAEGKARIWVTIDGKTVPVAKDPQTNAADDGKVVFCNRFYRRQTAFTDPQSTIKTYETTRAAHAFNWVALNVGGAGVIHDIKVKGELTTSATSGAHAEVAVGKRSLVIEPTHMAVNESKTN